MQNLFSDHYHLCIRGKQLITDRCIIIEDHRQQNGCPGCNSHTGTDSLVYTVHFPRTIILSHKGSDRYTKGIDDHPEQAVDLAVCCPCRYRIRSQCIHAGLDQNIGRCIHYRLQSRRKSDPNDPVEHSSIKTDLAQFQTMHIFRPHQHPQYQHSTERLRQDRSKCGTCHTHMQSDDKHNVQYNIGQAADDQKIQRSLGIPHSPQDAGSHVVDQIPDNAQKIDSDIGCRRSQNILRCRHRAQCPWCRRNTHDHHADSRYQAERNGGMYGIAYHLGTFCPIILRDNDCGTAGQSHEKSHQQLNQRTGAATYRRQSFFSDKAPYDHRIRCII